MGAWLAYNLTETFSSFNFFIQENLELAYKNILVYKEINGQVCCLFTHLKQ